MVNTEIDIDRIVDYKSEYCSAIRKSKISGNSVVGLCPFHKDSNNSFSADMTTGQWHCFSEDIGGNFTSFYAKLHGLSTSDAYKEILEKYNVSTEPKAKEEKTESGLQPYTLQQYAFEKRLPEDWLKDNCCLSTAKDKDKIAYLKIPYFDSSNNESTHRRRFAGKQFRWKYGSSGKICLYGEWKLQEIRNIGYAAIVEGESDSQTMWYMSISTLGVPGASLFKPKQAELLQDLKLYIHVEPDKGGETFLRKMTEGLREGGFIGEVYQWSCKIYGVKDPSELYIKYGKEDAANKIMNALKTAVKIDLDAPEDIPEAVKGAPVNLRQPEGWIYSDKGISRIDEKKYVPTMVCRTPIILTQRLVSIESGDEKVELAFKRDGTWQKAILPRSTVFTARGITMLADLGCTVTSENAKQVVSFLSALEAENIDIIRKSESTSTFGWQPGKRFVPGNEQGIVLDIEPSQKGMALAYCQNGTMEQWINMMQEHRSRDKFRFILAASFTAPLLRIIKQRIFFVYNWGGSKGGKTAALKAALSAWGDPERLMVSFNATQVGLERTASFYCDLPLGIDERQLAGAKQEAIEKIVYMIASGSGRIRGSKNGGLQTMYQWRTVALATGEEPLSTETSQTGISTRVLEIYGGPFPDEKSASLMHQQSTMNCGWTGPEFIRRILQVDERDICDKYDQMTEYVYKLSNGKNGSHIAGIAAVALADAMIDTWFFSGSSTEKFHIKDESWERSKQMAETILMEQMSSGNEDVSENATQFLVDWIMSNKDSFGEKAFGTCLGFITGSRAYIFPSMMNQALQKAGYSPRKTLKYLADNDLVTSSTDKSGKKVYSVIKWFANRSCRFVEFAIGKLAEEADPLNEDDAAEASQRQPERSEWKQVQMGDDFPFADDDDGTKLPFS